MWPLVLEVPLRDELVLLAAHHVADQLAILLHLIQARQVRLGVLHRGEEGVLEVPRDVLELVRVQHAQPPVARAPKVALVHPSCPQRGLGQPSSPAKRNDGVILDFVLEHAVARHVHARLRRDLALAKYDVALGYQQRRDRQVADLVHHLWVHADVLVEERVNLKDGGVHLEVDLHAQRLGHEREQGHLVLLHQALVLVHRVPRVALDAQGQAVADAVLAQVLPQAGELHAAAAAQDVQLRHRGGQGAHGDGGEHESQQENDDVEHALFEGHRLDLVHAAVELSDRPMHGHDVQVGQGVVLEPPSDDPRRLGVRTTEAIPTTSRKVRIGQHEEQQLGDVGNAHQALRLHPEGHPLEDALQPSQPQQPDHPHDPEGAGGLAHPADARHVVRAGDEEHHLEPIDEQQQHVHPQPRHRVVLRDVLHVQFDEAVPLDVARDERAWAVQRPEDPRDPDHPAECRAVGQLEELQGENHHVVHQQGDAGQVP
mmetsp:Transcript_90661/g.253297  ORF Transcript_90661/g.253297 Transcript_90661/m.253297 type:complete len:485 (+) Transcript_90661:272-1726(+)